MAKSSSNRILATPSSYARKHYLYVQEVGTLQSLEPHVSKRQNLSSYLFLVVLDGEGTLSYMKPTALLPETVPGLTVPSPIPTKAVRNIPGV